MNRFRFSKLRDIAKGDFAIKDGRLFYQDKEIAAGGTILFDSSEEVFFLFSVDNSEVQTEFKYVILLNYHSCSFYPCAEYQRNGDRLVFSNPDGQKYTFRRYCYNGSICSSKIIGGRS